VSISIPTLIDLLRINDITVGLLVQWFYAYRIVIISGKRTMPAFIILVRFNIQMFGLDMIDVLRRCLSHHLQELWPLQSTPNGQSDSAT
jgi:hypothetical protein